MTLPAGIAFSRARHLSRLTLTLAMLACAVACGSNPNSPSKVPQFGGTWTGTYLVTSCTATGAFQTAAICPTNGTAAPFQLSMTQADRLVTGTFTLGSLGFPSLGGNVAADGSLSFVGANGFSGIQITVTWNLTTSGSTLTGTLNQVWTDLPTTDQVTLAGTLSTATRQ